MAASVQYRPQERTLGMVMREVDEDLALFLQMRRSVKEKEDHIHSEMFEQFNDSLFEKSPADATAKENLLSSENDRNDYDWLLSPPRAPSNPSLDEEENTVGKHSDSTESDSMPADSLKDQASQNSSYTSSARSTTSSSSMNSCSAGNGRPASSKGRKSTPTGRPRVPSISKTSRPSTPTSRASLPSSAKTIVAPKRTSSGSSVPTASKSASRSATPTTRRTPTPARSSSVAKTAPTKVKKPESARGASPTVKSRPSSTHDAPKNSQSSMPKRPVSASRGRPIAPRVRPSSAKTRHRSCSPSRGQIPNIHSHWNGSLSKTRGYSNGEDDVNPVLMGTKMVERVVNMRKLAPPKHDDHQSSSKDSSKKSSISQKGSSFGTSFSKKSLDMAIRHMEIRRSSSGNAPRATKRGSSATRSNASPDESSINNGSEVEDSNSQPSTMAPITS